MKASIAALKAAKPTQPIAAAWGPAFAAIAPPVTHPADTPFFQSLFARYCVDGQWFELAFTSIGIYRWLIQCNTQFRQRSLQWPQNFSQTSTNDYPCHGSHDVADLSRGGRAAADHEGLLACRNSSFIAGESASAHILSSEVALSSYTGHEKTESATKGEAHDTWHDGFARAAFHGICHLRKVSDPYTRVTGIRCTLFTIFCSDSLMPADPLAGLEPGPGMPGKLMVADEKLRIPKMFNIVEIR